MADYREISQEYAQGAIRAVVLLNSGAAIAVLTQLADLPAGMTAAVKVSIIAWVIGATLGAVCWLIAFIATRYADKWQDEDNDQHRIASNRLQLAGVLCLVASMICFAGASTTLALSYGDAPEGEVPAKSARMDSIRLTLSDRPAHADIPPTADVQSS